MTAYAINYTCKGETRYINIDAKDLKSAKKKIGRKYGYKDGRMVKINTVSVIGYL